MKWKEYVRTNVALMRPYIPGESLDDITLSATDTPEEGGMIAQNPKNPANQWYVAKEYFNENYKEKE